MKKKILALALAICFLIPTVSAWAKENNKANKGGSLTMISKTEKNPFPENAGDSELFRIPGLTVLNDGSLFAVADARYTTTGDGGGLDTIFAVSKDSGENWEQGYAIMYPDSKGFADTLATTCIDPCVVEGEDGTIYVIADMNPTGVTTKPEYISPNVDTGYITLEGKEHLALTDDYNDVNNNPREKSYPYYLGEEKEGYSQVISLKDNKSTKWLLDSWLNIYEKDEKGNIKPIYQKQVDSDEMVQQNAFYKDSALHIYNTGYLLMVTSRDKGKTWTPRILNTQIKRHEETALLVSPGKGTLASDGTIIIPFYNFLRTDDKILQRASFIYSKDNGKTWERTEDAPNGSGVEWSSESEIVEVYNGVLRMFIRNGTGKISYIDASWNEKDKEYKWSEPVVTDIDVWSNCNLTASLYSKEIDGKKAVMVACPEGKKRTKGKIFTFLLNEDNSMIPAYEYRVNTGDYAYSCMDELKDGRIGLLYEAKPGTFQYRNLELSDIVSHKIGYGKKLTIGAAVLGSAVGVGLVASAVTLILKKRKNKK